MRRRVSVTIKGSEEGGAPTLQEFLRQLEAIKVALQHTERIETGNDEPDVYFRIVGLSMSSPATVVLEETPAVRDGKRRKLPKVPISQRFVATLSQISRHGTVPTKARDLAALEAYRSVGSAAKTGVITIASAARTVAIEPAFDTKVERIIGPDQSVAGSITGVLLAINLHNTTRFEIYPAVGPRKVSCSFPAAMKDQVIRGIDRNVRVIGTLRYKHWAPFPHAVTAETIEVFPSVETLPTLESLYGLLKRDGDTAPADG